MNQVWYFVKIACLNNFAYSSRIILDLFGNIFLLVLFYFLWSTVFIDTEDVGGYSFQSLMTYYALSFVLRQITVSGRVLRNITKAVHDGTLSTFLVKPSNFLLYEFWTLSTEKIFKTILPICLFLFAGWWYPDIFSWSSNLFTFLISLGFAFVLNFLIYATLGVIAFWTTNTGGIRSIYGRVVDIMSGSLFPLDLLPAWLDPVIKFLPFPYLHFNVIEIYIGQIDNNQIGYVLLGQGIWILLMILVFNILWKKGVRRYDSVGN